MASKMTRRDGTKPTRLRFSLHDVTEAEKYFRGLTVFKVRRQASTIKITRDEPVRVDSPKRTTLPPTPTTPLVEECAGSAKGAVSQTESLAGGSTDGTSCFLCGVHFEDRKGQARHFQSDWHHYNLKQNLRGLGTVSEERFYELAENISSLSGTDTSNDSGSDSDCESAASSTARLLEKQRRLHNSYQRRHLPSSDSDSDSEGEAYGKTLLPARHVKAYFQNAVGQILSLYKAAFCSHKGEFNDEDEILQRVRDIPKSAVWVVLMAGAGHFAGAVFINGKAVVHKTFHRYVIRAKRGTLQSASDNQKGLHRSAGAALRRHNEMAIIQDVQELLKTWSIHLSQASCIFVRASTSCKAMFFEKRTGCLERTDPRVRMIPFPTRRATFSEVQRVYSMLAECECQDAADWLSESSSKRTVKKRAVEPKSNSAVDVLSKTGEKSGQDTKDLQLVEEGENSSDSGEVELVSGLQTLDLVEQLQAYASSPTRSKRKHKKKTKTSKPMSESTPQCVLPAELDPALVALRNQLYTSCKSGDLGLLQTTLDTAGEGRSSEGRSSEGRSSEGRSSEGRSSEGHSSEAGDRTVDLNMELDDKGNTSLHCAAAAGWPEIVSVLLMAGSDPSVKNHAGKPAYLCTESKAVRNELRIFKGKFPDKFDYSESQIPEPLTEVELSEKKRKEAEKRKVLNAAKKERMKGKKLEAAKQREEDAEKSRFVNLSEREKRALAAESRLLKLAKQSGAAAPTLSRCWDCGVDITGKVPFEYFDYTFCTPLCMKTHRKKINQLKK